MKEMKSYLNSIQDGIRMIAANTVVNNAELSGQTPQVNNPTEVEVDTHESIISNPDHIELVSVDIVNEDNDSIASADDQVHEIHTATEGAPHHMHNFNFKSNLNLTSVQINHKTYHHFLGGGLFDSNIDVLLFIDDKDVHEEVTDVYCKEVHPIIQSYHDVISSVFKLPAKITQEAQSTLQVPVIPNIRKKTVWSVETIPAYQCLICQSLADLRKRWSVPSSRSSVALLIQLSSQILSSAASASNTTFALADSPSIKSSEIPKAIKSAQNRLQRLCKN